MKEKPILFSGPMVRAILEGRKTQTRRVISPQPTNDTTGSGHWYWKKQSFDSHRWPKVEIESPYGKSGDHLWLKENHRLTNCECRETCRIPGHVWYETDGSGYEHVSFQKLRPSIFMPRWASRITLEIVSVRVERLQEITGKDALAEGILQDDGQQRETPNFRQLWDSINGKKYPWSRQSLGVGSLSLSEYE